MKDGMVAQYCLGIKTTLRTLTENCHSPQQQSLC